MKVTTFCKFGITAGAAALLVGGLAVPAATADPAPTTPTTFGTLVGLGSDTTQDVVNGLGAAIPGNKIASYDAVGSQFVTTRAGGVDVPRASASGPGRDLLRVAIGQIAGVSITSAGVATPVNANNSVGLVDFARSSSGPATGDQTGEGVLAYIPFARDAVSVAVAEGSPLSVVPFVLGNNTTAGSTVPSLYNIYRGSVKFAFLNADESYNSVGAAAADAPAGTTSHAIKAVLPKSGSGTRSFFIGKLGLDETAVGGLITAGTITAKYGTGNADVQEHDGTALVGDAAAIVPFSIAQWVAQANSVAGVSDRRHGAQILGLNATPAVTSAASVYSTNPNYTAMVRDVYNIVPSKLADDASSDIAKAFVGANSEVCTATSTISAYGFQLLPGTTPETTCGFSNLRAYVGSPSSVSVEFSDSTVAVGSTVTATATVGTSNHNKGGTVFIVDAADNTVAQAPIAAGATTVAIPVTPTAITSLSLHAEFVPTLAGVKGSVSPDVALNVTASPSDVTVSAPSATRVGVAVPVIAWIGGVNVNGGTVTFRDGETVLGTTVVGAGEQGAFFSFIAKKTTYALTATYAAPTGSTTSGSVSAVKAIELGKGTPKITPAKFVSVKASQKGKVVLTVSGVAGAVPTGTVTIREGAKVLVSKTISSSTGKATVILPKLKKGTHKLVITYNGDTRWNTGTKSLSIKIK
ncbi:Ig-like domain repeat protein [Glaciihabitans arcticus]|uniref:Ig-like domain repeat protein n=1 Tax=Glaciihabitans arcticus TaxID=2668039 RepID=A0A4Q9GXL6_9MICO|nr:Ig-like domain-containing protein [Glaciihabitans arcticus]TBN57020.1 Ig-like domain repeat protein [Glaciihabitans arcticus]